MGIFLKRQRTGEGSFYINTKLRFVPFLPSTSSSQQHPPTPDFLVDSASPCPWGTTRGRALRVTRIPCAHTGAEQAPPISPSLPQTLSSPTDELLAATKGSDNKHSLRAAFALPSLFRCALDAVLAGLLHPALRRRPGSRIWGKSPPRK